MKICEFVNSEIRYMISECNFTKDEKKLFLLRTKDIPLEECAERMNVSIVQMLGIMDEDGNIDVHKVIDEAMEQANKYGIFC